MPEKGGGIMAVHRNPCVLNEYRQTAVLERDEFFHLIFRGVRYARRGDQIRPPWGTKVGRQPYRSWKARRASQWK
jgi:hypothetical protein